MVGGGLGFVSVALLSHLANLFFRLFYLFSDSHSVVIDFYHLLSGSGGMLSFFSSEFRNILLII